MKRNINRKIVDPKGYSKSNEKNTTDYKIIPSNNITMKDVKDTILGIMLDKRGNPKGFEFMEPGEEYLFDDTSAVVEIPKYAVGGDIPSNKYAPGYPQVSPDYFNFSTDFYNTPGTISPITDPTMQQAIRRGMGNEWMAQNENVPGNFVNINDPYNAQSGAENMDIYTDPEQLKRMQENNQINTQNSNYDEDGNAIDTSSPGMRQGDFQFFNPYAGVDIPTAAFTLGSSIEEGDALGIAASGLKLATGLARNAFSGVGIAKRQKEVMKDYRSQQRDYVTGANRVQYMQEGGKIEKALTGEFIFGMDEVNPMTAPNAEIEAGEYVQHPNTEIQQAEGEKHAQGGVEVALEDNTKILSDHLKLGGNRAKQFRDKFDLELKASDTYSTVLDKFNKKSGLEKIVKEQEELFAAINKQQKNTEDEESLGLNMQYLSGKVNELENKKKPLEEARKILFEEVYKIQEQDKPKEEKDEDVFQKGGQFKELAAKRGISEERAAALIKQYQDGGDISRYYSPLPTNTGNFGRQKFTQGTNLSGAVTPDEAVNRLRAQSQTLPYLVQRSGIGGAYDFGQIPELLRDPSLLDSNGNPLISSVNPQNTSHFQVGYDEYIRSGETAINNNPYLTTEQKQKLQTTLKSQMFGEGLAKDYDSIYGDFTSSRNGFGLPILTAKDKELYGNKIKFIGDAFTPEGNIKPEFADLDPKTKDYLQNLVKDKGQTVYDISVLDVPNQTPANAATPDTPATGDGTVNNDVVNNFMGNSQQEVDRMGVLLLPDQNPLPPSSLQPHLKVNRRFDRVNPALISTEQNLQELRRQEASATDQINLLPDSQRIAALANLNVNTQENINKVVSETAKINSQITTQTDAQNAQTQRMEENAAANDALSFEQRQLTAQARTQNDYANYYNTVTANNMRNFNTINDLNLLNAMHDDFQFTGNGIEKTSPDILFRNPTLIPKAAEQTKKPKKKFGGRFKK